jgi:hypothetical protein
MYDIEYKRTSECAAWINEDRIVPALLGKPFQLTEQFLKKPTRPQGNL